MENFSLEEVCCGRSPMFASTDKYYDNNTIDTFEVSHNDAEKIINCSAFRRMQGKTQVYPFPETDAVRNRLTHSIEVSHIGQAIASKIFSRLDVNDLLKRTAQQLVANGCLLHDIGNPPFGHSGEESIREFFKDTTSLKILHDLSGFNNAINDFINFDGNAQGFHIVTNLNGRKYDGGLRLSAATLSSMVKYPYRSADEKGKKGKFGFMVSDYDYSRRVFRECGLLEDDGTIYRNPLSVIVEAADDIAYLTADLQDAFVYGDLDYNFVKRELSSLAGEAINYTELDAIKDPKDRVSLMRSAAVNEMIKQSVKNLYEDCFRAQRSIGCYEKINIWKNPRSVDIEDSEEKIRDKSNEKIYRGRKKMTLQVAGGRIIKFVLDMQISALNELYQAFMKSKRSLPSIDIDVRKKISGSLTEDKYAAYLIKIIEDLVSRQASQVILRLPEESIDNIRHLLLASLKRPEAVSGDKDPELAYRLVQMSVDFVAGTTDRYLSTYSREWAGPALT